MSIKTPSYIVKSRHGIWYFQIHLTNQFRYENKRRLFRRSLRTKDRTLALKRARVWWIRMSENDFDWEDKARTDDELYHRGKLIFEKLSELDSDDQIEIDNFLETLDFNETNALKFYNDYINNKSVVKNETIVKDSNSTSPLLSQLFEKFITEKRRNWGEKQAKSTEQKDYRPKILQFIEIVGDKEANKLTKNDTVKYKDTILHLPSHIKTKKAYKDKTIKEILALEIPKSDLLSGTTIKNRFVKVGTFLTWLAKNGYADSSLETPLHGVIKKSKRASEDRDVFDEQDLKNLFNNKYYFSREHSQASRYWIPLLALFTGARLNELCQLHASDIKEVDGIWVIDINDEDDKRIKSYNAKRQIPIHSILLKKLKFIDYVNNSKRKNKRLFPELKQSDDGHSREYSKWFNATYRKNTHVGQNDNNKKNFHSFRHTFSNYYKHLGNIEEFRVAEIIGHESDTTSITYDRYGKSSDIKNKKKLIEKLKFDFIAFDKFRIWKN